MLKKVFLFLKRNLFLYTMLLSLLIPDIVLRAQSSTHRPWVLTGVPVLFTVLWVALVMLICTGFLSKRWGRGLYLAVVVLFSVFMVSSYIYYKIFNKYFWLDTIGMTGQAMEYGSYILANVDWILLLATALQIFLICVTCRTWRNERYKPSGLWLILPVVGLVTVHTFMMTETLPTTQEEHVEMEQSKSVYKRFTDSNRSMQTAGTYQYVFRNLLRLVFPEGQMDESATMAADTYFAEKDVSGDNEKTGIFAGKNVIMVMMESLDDWMIKPAYTPTICYMMEKGIDFSNHFSCTFGSGYTFNTEFAANTGYHATLTGMPVSELSDNAFPHSLANSFRKKGYSARELHYNTPDFYNRGDMSRAFGYEEYISFQKYLPMQEAQCDATAISDPKVYREIAPRQDNPFFHYVITYSAHLPYTDDEQKMQTIKAKYPELVDETLDTEINNALILAHDTDEFFRILLENLEADGMLDNTVIIGFSDHFAYGISDWQKLYAMNDAKTADMLEHTPFFVYCKGTEGEKVEKVTNTLDILPTVVNLFGLEKTPYWIGQDAFDPAYGGYAYFSNGAWYDGDLHYFAEEQSKMYPRRKKEYIAEMNDMFMERELVNEVVLRTDYFGAKETEALPPLPVKK